MDALPPKRKAAPASASGSAGEADRRRRIGRVAEQLRDCLKGLDDLELWKAGAHADLALTEVERHL